MVRKYSLFVLCSIGFKSILIDKTIDKQQSCSWKIPFHLSICHNSTLYTDREIGLNIAKMLWKICNTNYIVYTYVAVGN